MLVQFAAIAWLIEHPKYLIALVCIVIAIIVIIIIIICVCVSKAKKSVISDPIPTTTQQTVVSSAPNSPNTTSVVNSAATDSSSVTSTSDSATDKTSNSSSSNAAPKPKSSGTGNIKLGSTASGTTKSNESENSTAVASDKSASSDVDAAATTDSQSESNTDAKSDNQLNQASDETTTTTTESASYINGRANKWTITADENDVFMMFNEGKSEVCPIDIKSVTDAKLRLAADRHIFMTTASGKEGDLGPAAKIPIDVALRKCNTPAKDISDIMTSLVNPPAETKSTAETSLLPTSTTESFALYL